MLHTRAESEPMFSLLTVILLILTLNKNEKFRSFKSKENIHKKDVGPYRSFGYKSLISDPISLAKGARGKYCIFENFNMTVISKTDISRKIPKYSYPQKKPDTFRLGLTRKVQIIELKTNTYFNSKTLKSIFKENLFIKYRT